MHAIKMTVPDGASRINPGDEVPSWAFVIAWSATEPHRVGEVAFLRAFERMIVGRGDDDVPIAQFAAFGRQRPGEPLVAASLERNGSVS